MKEWQEYERIVAKIYEELGGDFKVALNDYIKGVDSGIDRQIDVSLRSNISGEDILIIIQVKDWGYKADINVLGEFDSVIKDVRAQKGILIARSGFTSTCFKYAKNLGLELCTAYTALNKKWHIEDIKIPMIKVIHRFDYEFIVDMNPLSPSRGTLDSFDLHAMIMTKSLTKDNHQTFFSLSSLLFDLYKDNKINFSPGNHSLKLETDDLTMVANNYTFKIKEIIVTYKNHSSKYVKDITPIDYRAIKDYSKNHTQFTYVEINENLMSINDGTWTKIKPDTVIPSNCQIIDCIHLDLGTVHYFKCTLEKKE